MSVQELRDLLEAELAELSDCDELDASDDLDWAYDNAEFRSYEKRADSGLHSDVEKVSSLDDIEEWQQLMRSSAQVDERIQGMKISLADDFESLSFSRFDRASSKSQINDSCHGVTDTTTSTLVESCSNSAINNTADYSLLAVNPSDCDSISDYMATDEEGVLKIDMITFGELKELMNFIIEAVERSAPIIPIPLAKAVCDAIDKSGLPKEIRDENEDYISDLVLYQTTSDSNPTSYPGGNYFELQTRQPMDSEKALNESAEILRYEAALAKEKSLAWKGQLLERKRIIEEELREHKSCLASVRIQSIFRQRSQKKKYIVLLEMQKIEKTTKEDEEKAVIEAVRLEAVRVQKLEENRSEKYRRLEEDRQIMLAAAAKCQKEASLKRIEVERESIESLLMAEMEAFSVRAWEYERISELLRDAEEANCIVCHFCSIQLKSTNAQRRRKKKVRRSSNRESCTEMNEETKSYEVSINIQKKLSPEEIFLKQQEIESMSGNWSAAAHSAIADCKGRELLHGITDPEGKDLVRVLGVELLTMQQTVSRSTFNRDREKKEIRTDQSSKDAFMANQAIDEQRCKGNDLDGPLLQALTSWQQWVLATGLSTRSAQILAGTGATTTSPTTGGGETPSLTLKSGPSPLVPEESNQLLSFGLRPLRLSEPGLSYHEISLGVESLTSCAFLRTFTQLKRLQLNVNKLRTLTGLEHLSSLEELHIKDNAISSLSTIGQLSSLRSLSVDDNNLNAQGLATLAHLRDLHTLSANTNKLHTFPFLAGCHGLQRLHLYHNSISMISTSSLTPLCSLMHLDLGRNKLETVSGAALSQCPLLQTIVLSQNLLTAPPSPLYLPNLRTMWLSGNKLQDLRSWLPYKDPYINQAPGSDSRESFSDRLVWPLFIPLIEKLYLSDNLLSEINAAAVCNMPLLSDLDISFNSLLTTVGLEGLRFLPKLSSLQLHDNPVYSSNSSSSSSSSSSSETKVNELMDWLIKGCPSLRIVSGSVLQRTDLPTVRRASVVLPVNATESISSAALDSSSPIPSASATIKSLESSARCREVLLDEFRRTGRWITPTSVDLSLHTQLRIDEASAQFVDHRDRDGVCLPNLFNTSEPSRQLVQTLLMLHYDQNVLKAREKIENVRIKYPVNALDIGEEDGQENDRRYWETALVQQLEAHTSRLVTWSWKNGITHDLPMVRMLKFQIPVEVEEVVILVDQFIAPYPLTAERSSRICAEDAHDIISSDSSQSPTAFSVPIKSSYCFHLSEGPIIEHSGVSRLQAVWRSRRVRARVQSALLASRYQDEELDELLGGVDFDLDEALSLQGYEEYLSPVGLKEGWQSHPKTVRNSSTFKTTGENGWVEGAIERRDHGNADICHDESRIEDKRCGSFAPQGMSLVYGDHRRKKSTQREGTVHHQSPDCWDGKQSAYHQVSAFSNSQTDQHDWSSRPSSSLTDTSSLSGASSRAHTEPDLYRSLLPLSAGGNNGHVTDTRSTELDLVRHHAEWGMNDPKAERNKCMKGFAAAQDYRNKEKEAHARCHRIAKNAKSGSQPSTTMSWGGGGAAGVSTSTGSGRGRGRMGGGGRSKGRKTMPPAWALAASQEQEQGEENGDDREDEEC